MNMHRRTQAGKRRNESPPHHVIDPDAATRVVAAGDDEEMPQHNANDDELEYIDLSLPSPNQLQHPTSSTHSHPRMRLVDLTVDIPSSERRVPQEKLTPPRWRTKEFLLYYVVALFVLPLMAYIPMRLSHREWSYACRRRIN